MNKKVKITEITSVGNLQAFVVDTGQVFARKISADSKCEKEWFGSDYIWKYESYKSLTLNEHNQIQIDFGNSDPATYLLGRTCFDKDDCHTEYSALNSVVKFLKASEAELVNNDLNLHVYFNGCSADFE